jgi:hypothetical protein
MGRPGFSAFARSRAIQLFLTYHNDKPHSLYLINHTHCGAKYNDNWHYTSAARANPF